MCEGSFLTSDLEHPNDVECLHEALETFTVDQIGTCFVIQFLQERTHLVSIAEKGEDLGQWGPRLEISNRKNFGEVLNDTDSDVPGGG